jgi:ABC-2 type transport system permease protein
VIGVVARKELRACVRDGRVRAGALMLLVLGLMALVSAAARYTVLSQERRAAQAVIETQWLEQGEKNPHSAAHYGLYAFRPAQPLSFFDPGVLAFEGVSVWLEAHKRNFASGRPIEDMTALARFGELSLAFILQALLPLALIIAAYPAFTQERESGTLRQLLSAGATPAQVFLGKFIGIGAAILVLVGPFVLLCVAALVFVSGWQWLVEASLLLVVYLLYAAIVLLLCLIVSARASSTANALIVLLGFWAVSTFVVPRLAADVGRFTTPVPSAQALLKNVEDGIATGIDGVSPAAAIERRRAGLLRLYKVEREQDLPINFQGIVFEIQDEISDAVHDREFGALGAAVDRQNDALEAASILSPRLALSFVSQELAGTSVARQRHFEERAEAFRRGLMDALNRDITFNSRAGDTNYRAGADLWRKTGGFRYESEPLTAAVARCGAPLTVLALWLIALAVVALVTTRNLRVLPA